MVAAPNMSTEHTLFVDIATLNWSTAAIQATWGLSRFHPEEAAWVKDEHLKPVVSPTQSTLHEMTELAPGSERAKKITMATSYFNANDMRPDSMVENQGFRYIVHSMEPRYVIPSRSF